MIRKLTHHLPLAEAPEVSSVSPLSGHMLLSRLMKLKSDKASYSSAHRTQSSENPSPWKLVKVIYASLWYGY